MLVKAPQNIYETSSQQTGYGFLRCHVIDFDVAVQDGVDRWR